MNVSDRQTLPALVLLQLQTAAGQNRSCDLCACRVGRLGQTDRLHTLSFSRDHKCMLRSSDSGRMIINVYFNEKMNRQRRNNSQMTARYQTLACTDADVWRRAIDIHDLCNMILYQWFGGSVMVWEANPWREVQTDLYRLDTTTLTAIRCGDEILHSLQTRWCAARPHVDRVCRHFLEDKWISLTGPKARLT